VFWWICGNWLARLLARLVLQRLSVEMTMRAVCGKEEAVLGLARLCPLCFHMLCEWYGNATHSPVMGSKTTQTWCELWVVGCWLVPGDSTSSVANS